MFILKHTVVDFVCEHERDFPSPTVRLAFPEIFMTVSEVLGSSNGQKCSWIIHANGQEWGTIVRRNAEDRLSSRFKTERTTVVFCR